MNKYKQKLSPEWFNLDQLVYLEEVFLQIVLKNN